MASKVMNVPPLRPDGYRTFTISGLAEAMQESRTYVEQLVMQPGFPYFQIDGMKNKKYLECAVCKWMRENVRYVHQV